MNLEDMSQEEAEALIAEGLKSRKKKEDAKAHKKAIEAEIAEAQREYDSKPGTPEDREVELYKNAQERAARGDLPVPPIPKYIEVPVQKDWSSMGSMHVSGANGSIETQGATEMKKIINPAWEQQQADLKKASEPPPLAAFSAPGSLTFADAQRISELLENEYEVTGMQYGNVIIRRTQ